MLNIMNPPADWSTMKKLIWLRGTPINGGEDLTVSGTPPLTLPNSLGKPLKAWSVDLLPYQEGTGDPAPDNVRPIHGTDKVSITTSGKNLLPTKFYNGITYNPEVGVQLTPTDITNQVTVEGDKYSLTASGSWQGFSMISEGLAGASVYCHVLATSDIVGAVRSMIYITDDDYVVTRKIVATTGDYQWDTSITMAENEKYIVIAMFTTPASTISFNAPQIEFGSTATPYTPYISPSQTVITLPQTVYTGIISEQGGESRWGEVDLGTLSWIYNTQNNTFYALVSDKAFGQPDNLICEQYKPSRVTGFNLSDYEISVGASNAYVYVKDPRYTTVSDFKTAVSGVKLVYPLETPVQFSITAPTIPTPTGTATVWATAEDGTVDSMSVTYVGKA